jgi:putative FmdB family regulatory protein
MPLYEYQCGECGHRFEKLMLTPAAASDKEVFCPVCNKLADRVWSVPVHRFYGPGFFKPNVRKRGEGIGTKRQPKESPED